MRLKEFWVKYSPKGSIYMPMEATMKMKKVKLTYYIFTLKNCKGK